MLVRVLQRLRRLADEVTSVRHWQRPLLLHVPRQVDPLDELHDQKVRAASLVGVEGADNVGVVQLGRRLHFALETLDRLGIVEQLGVDDLQGDEAIHLLVSGLVDGAHASLPQQLKDLVAGVLHQFGGNGLCGPVGRHETRRRGRAFRSVRVLPAERLGAAGQRR